MSPLRFQIKTNILILLLFPCLVPRAESGEPLHCLQLESPQQLRDLLEPTAAPVPIVSAHRGGAVPGYPENCIATFENTLRHTWAILEIDVRNSRDGRLVLHHDATLDRTTNGSGPLAGKTLSELQQLRLVDREGTITDYPIPTLDEAIEWARGKAILILDRKDGLPVEACVRKIQEHKAQAFVMIMAYNMEDIKTVHQLDPGIMLEVFMGTRERFEQFAESGVPWDRIVAFISHQPPDDLDLIGDIRARGAATMAGTSRYLDRELKAGGTPSPELAARYHQLLDAGIDIIETDLPGAVAEILYGEDHLPEAMSRILVLPE